MARKKPSTARDVLNSVSLLPWWMTLILAPLSYGVCHYYALDLTSTPVTIMPNTSLLIGVFAKVGQWLTPVLCLIASAVSYVGAQRRKALLGQVRHDPTDAALVNMGWQDFERLVGAAYKEQGYQVTETGGGGPDGGIDLELTKGRERFLVQCKHWRAQTVGVTVVRELYGVMSAHGATGGLVISSGRFSADAEAFAAGRNIQLIGGEAFVTLIRRGEAASAHTRSEPSDMATPSRADTQGSSAVAAKFCPRCGAEMRLRRSAKGSKIGEQFWGCSTFPACRGTRAA